MKVIGPLPPEIAEQLGKCEVCGEQATNIVKDFLEMVPFDQAEPTHVDRLGTPHRFCNEHVRDSKFTRVYEGPQLYWERRRSYKK